MCGRFTLTADTRDLLDMFELGYLLELEPRYNIAPTQDVAAVRAWPTGERDAAALRWGLLPFWAKDPKMRKPVRRQGNLDRSVSEIRDGSAHQVRICYLIIVVHLPAGRQGV